MIRTRRWWEDYKLRKLFSDAFASWTPWGKCIGESCWWFQADPVTQPARWRRRVGMSGPSSRIPKVIKQDRWGSKPSKAPITMTSDHTKALIPCRATRRYSQHHHHHHRGKAYNKPLLFVWKFKLTVLCATGGDAMQGVHWTTGTKWADILKDVDYVCLVVRSQVGGVPTTRYVP